MGKQADHVRRHQSPYRAHVGFLVANAAFAAIFVALVLSAFHTPAPHDLPVAIVAPPAATGQVEDALNRGGQDTFDLRVYPSLRQARTAIARRDVDGALEVSKGGLRLLIAEADGTGPAGALTRAFSALASRTGRPLVITDVAAPGADDTQALSPFFVVLGVLFPSLAAGSACALVFRRSRPAWCVAAPAAAAVVVGVIAAGIANGVAGLHSYVAVAGIVGLFSLAISAPTAALGRIWPPLISVAVLVFMVLGIPASGGPASLGAFGPAFLRVLHPALPLGAAASAVRGAVYFHGYGTAAPAWILTAWASAGIIGILLAVASRPKPAVRPLSAATSPAVDLPALTDGVTTAGPAVGLPALTDGVTTAGPAAALMEGGPAVSSAHAPAPSLVVGFDNSEPARRALAWTARLAAAHRVGLHVIYADHAGIDSDLSGFAHAEMVAARDKQAAVVEQAAADIMTAVGVPYTFERRQGAPADAILAGASAAVTPDGNGPAIIVGRSGHAAHHVLGSVPVRLLHHSSYPVLTVP